MKGAKIRRLRRSSLLPGFMPPKPEKQLSTVRTSETTTAPTRAGDWKKASQSPRPRENAAHASAKRTPVLSTAMTSQRSRRVSVMAVSSTVLARSLFHAARGLHAFQPVADLVELAVDRVG